MSRTLAISAAAARDLETVRQWLKQRGAGEVAAKRLANIRSAVKELRLYPCKWPEGEHPGVRERPIEGYMIMYEVYPDTDDNRTAGNVEVLRVFGPHQLRDSL